MRKTCGAIALTTAVVGMSLALLAVAASGASSTTAKRTTISTRGRVARTVQPSTASPSPTQSTLTPTVLARNVAPTGLTVQAQAAFDDVTGDAQGGGADIRRVAIVNDASGNVAIGVAYANRACATSTDMVYVELDVDQNTATGAQPEGTYYIVYVDGFNSERGVGQWNGKSLFTVLSVASFQASCDPQGFDLWAFNRTSLGIGSGFNIGVTTFPDPTWHKSPTLLRTRCRSGTTSSRLRRVLHRSPPSVPRLRLRLLHHLRRHLRLSRRHGRTHRSFPRGLHTRASRSKTCA